MVHHTRKGIGAPGDPDTARGASAIIGAVRSALTLMGMSEDDVLRDFPDLTRDDIRACLAFAADRERRLTATGTV